MIRRAVPLKRWAFHFAPRAIRWCQTAYHSDAKKWLWSAPSYPIDRLLQRRNGGIFAFDIFSQMGLGAMLTHTVKLLKYIDDSGLVPAIRFTNPLYAARRGEDWFGDYFALRDSRQVESMPRRLTFLRIAQEYSAGAFRVPAHLELAEAQRLFTKYIVIKPIILDAVDRLTQGLPNGKFDLSLHDRATDKVTEASAVSYQQFVDRLAVVLDSRKNVRTAFLATDDSGFVAFVKDRFPTVRFVSFYKGNHVPMPGEPRHYSAIPGPDKAIEALVNIVAISRSPVCIRTCSHLSSWSKILNLQMQTHSLNRLHQGIPSFPEHEIAASESHGADYCE
jgi:hypothetical protein